MGDIRVRSLSFSLDGDVDESGYRFMRAVLAEAPVQKQRGELSAIYPI